MGEPNCTGLLVVGHGTRSKHGLAEYWNLLALVAQHLPATTVEGGFLELAEPDIATATQRLAEQGVKQVLVMPLMLFEAGHAKRDIPRDARQAADRFGLKVQILPALIDHPQMVALSAHRFQATINRHNIDPRDACWVFVGRGSHDKEAIGQFRKFLAQRQQVTPVGSSQEAFMAMARPRIESLWDVIAQKPQTWVVVQPHLLLVGELLERLQRMVDRQDRLSRRQQWFMTHHLGGDLMVARVIQQRFLQAVGAQEVRCHQ